MENEVKEPAPKFNYISQEDYLAMERLSEEKHEYYDGEIYAMSGGSIQHNNTFHNVYSALSFHLKGKDCKPYGSDLRIHIPYNTLFTYPGISIICGKPEITDAFTDNVTNPSVIIEILSKTTKGYDWGTKFTLYRSIESLKEYILIASTKISVEVFAKQGDGKWLLSEFKNLHDTFYISTIKLTLFLKQVYEDVNINE